MKFVFEDDSLEVVLGEQQAETENAFVGGENKWAFSAFTNWEYWFPGFPVLVYFKASPCAGAAAAFGLSPTGMQQSCWCTGRLSRLLR